MNLILFYLVALFVVRSRREMLTPYRWEHEPYTIEIPFHQKYLSLLALLAGGLFLDSFSLYSLWYFFVFVSIGEYAVFEKTEHHAWSLKIVDRTYSATNDQVMMGLVVLIFMLAPSIFVLLLHIVLVQWIYPLPSLRFSEKKED